MTIAQFTKQDKKQLASRYKKGATFRQFEAAGISYHLARKVLLEVGCRLRGRGRPPQEARVASKDLRRGLAQFEKGRVSLGNLAQQWRCSKPTVVKVLKRHGLR